MSGHYGTYIALAYGISGLALTGSIAMLLLDYRGLKRALTRLGAPTDERQTTTAQLSQRDDQNG